MFPLSNQRDAISKEGEANKRRSSLGTSGEEMSLVYFLIAIIHFYAKSSQSRWRSHNLFSYSGDGRAGK
jgi:hypothetical protein